MNTSMVRMILVSVWLLFITAGFITGVILYKKRCKNVKTLIIAIVTISIPMMIATIIPEITAIHKGATLSQIMNMSVDEIITNNSKSLSPSSNMHKSIDKLKGSIVVTYKYGCHKCESVHDELSKAIDEATKNGINVYITPIDSNIAQQLIKETSPTDAPVAVYVRYKPDQLSGLKANYIAYVNKEPDGKMTFNQAGWGNLLKRHKELE